MAQLYSRFCETNGLQTHYLEAGEGGYPMVLLHSGEYGGCAESSWNTVIPVLASAGFHIYAPDWLGFGQSDKVVDFASPRGRRLNHMGQFIQDLRLPELPVIVGNSMGGTYLVQELANGNKAFEAAAAVVVSGGGFVPDNEARRAIQEYDLTKEGMRQILGVLLHDRKWVEDEEFVAWRHELSLVPGAWQCAAAARLSPPGTAHRGGDFGKDDRTRYEDVGCPTLVVAGAEDTLRLPDYACEISRRIPSSELLTYEECGHMPNIEFPERFAKDVIEFTHRFLGRDASLEGARIALASRPEFQS